MSAKPCSRLRPGRRKYNEKIASGPYPWFCGLSFQPARNSWDVAELGADLWLFYAPISKEFAAKG
jgi:hypothetical protein